MSIRILIIEDHVDNLELMAYLLSAYGYQTLSAGDGLGGMELIERETPDLIICDIQIPGIDGYEVARRVKRHAQLRTIPMVGITALAMVGDRDKVLAAGFDGYIAKPISPDTFLSEVEAFLAPHQRLSPLAAPVAEDPATQPSAAVHLAPRALILVVDNVRANLELARSIFEPSGYRVVLVSNGQDALLEARRVRPDLILSDIVMANGDGYELLSTVRADPELQSIPVILITASRAGDSKKALALGATKFLKRPIDPITLLGEVAGCLNDRAGRKAE